MGVQTCPPWRRVFQLAEKKRTRWKTYPTVDKRLGDWGKCGGLRHRKVLSAEAAAACVKVEARARATPLVALPARQSTA